MKNKIIVKRMRALLDLYEMERGFDNYQEDTVLQDLVFFAGRSIDPEKYQHAQGYRAFLKRLSEIAPPHSNQEE